jgi:hypothetical protein
MYQGLYAKCAPQDLWKTYKKILRSGLTKVRRTRRKQFADRTSRVGHFNLQFAS